MAFLGFGKKRFSDLSEQEILALAISSEEDDGRIYGMYADALRAGAPAAAAVFDEMAEEESGHRHRLIEMHRARFGERIPLIRRADVAGFREMPPVWLKKHLPLETIRNEAVMMEANASAFYASAAKMTSDAGIRDLLGALAIAEQGHVSMASRLGLKYEASPEHSEEKQAAHRKFVLEYVQPGLIGLMDGSVSTLAPLFAAAFATHDTWATFLVGLAASVGAGISMGLAEGLSDDGTISGRGSPLKRGLASGLMTAVGGLGHTLPYLIPNFPIATGVAAAIVLIELWAISWIRWKYMDTPFLKAAFQIVVGGALVFLTGILIGNA